VCSAALTYFDGTGKQLKTSTVTVAPGAIGYLDLFSDTDLALAADQRKQIRATVTVPVATCRLIPTLEIFDELTGRTSVVLVGFHPLTNETPTPCAARAIS
jgi:hypothetical protein